MFISNNRNNALREKFRFCFPRIFYGINKVLILAGGLATNYHSMKFRHFSSMTLF